MLTTHLPNARYPVYTRQVLAARLGIHNHLVSKQDGLWAQTVNCEIAEMELSQVGWAYLRYFGIAIVQAFGVNTRWSPSSSTSK